VGLAVDPYSAIIVIVVRVSDDDRTTRTRATGTIDTARAQTTAFASGVTAINAKSEQSERKRFHFLSSRKARGHAYRTVVPERQSTRLFGLSLLQGWGLSNRVCRRCCRRSSPDPTRLG
jgi:hypothetical protein